MSAVSWRTVLHDAFLIVAGSLIFAVGVDMFEIPNGLAAGGVTGLATVFYAIADNLGFYLPVGLQTIAMNVVLLALVVRSGDRGYIVRTVGGIIACGLLTDLRALVVQAPEDSRDDLREVRLDADTERVNDRPEAVQHDLVLRRLLLE